MLIEYARAFIDRHRLLEPGAPVLAAVSGGVDSVALLTVLHRLGYALRAAHVNYGLRGAASEADEALVRALCERLGVPLHVDRPATEACARARGQSIQAAARDLRYAFFERVAVAEGLPYVAVAHHRDDQAETVLLHLFRGSGVEGLAGMPVRRPLAHGSAITLVRPFLDVRRADIEAFAVAEGIAWREDASNVGLRYRRGAIREAILPRIVEHFGPAAVDNVARSAALVRAYVEETIRPTLARLMETASRERPGGGGVLARDALEAQPPVWRRRMILEALRRWLPGAPRSETAAETVERLLEAQTGRRVVFARGSVWREREGLAFVPEREEAGERAEITVEPGTPVTLPGGVLLVEAAPCPAAPGAGAPFVEYADADRITPPLTVRPWRAGDRFRPLGMKHHKKVSDFLTDVKIPAHERSGVYVLANREKIVWVVGLRLADEVRLRPDTSRCLRLRFAPHTEPAP
ncbi:tRNA lysidine(34) synthetase TilS [Rhodocaloribacter sp.]